MNLLKVPVQFKHWMMRLIDDEYVSKKLSKRTGNCKKCGECCKGCFQLKENLCKIYDKRPWFYCYKQFPLDRFDQKVWKVKSCGYQFKE